jgi:hypothetical protein
LKFIIKSDLLSVEQNLHCCAQAAAKLQAEGKIRIVEAKASYALNRQNNITFIVEGPNKNAVLSALKEQLDIPVASIRKINF